jgi:hypothetical protein
VSLAQGNQSNQGREFQATLIAPDPSFKIDVYAQPDSRRRRIGYGFGGMAVRVLEQVGSNDGSTWDRVRFENDPYLEGWIPETFVALGQELTEEKDDLGSPAVVQGYRNNAYQQDQQPHNSYQGHYSQNHAHADQAQQYQGYTYRGNQQQY